ncbi:MAG: tetratricopeptide repeat protein [Tepidamorphaceae bacterium]
MSLAHNGLGVVLLEQGKLEKAEASFRQALELQPGYAEAHNNIGNVLKEQERPEEAIAEYSKALELRA